MNKKYNLKLDLQFRCNNSIMKFNQFDNNTSDFFMRITNGGNLVDIEKAIVVLATIKPSGKVASQFVEIENGLVYADLKPNMKDEIGTYTAQAILILEDERVVTDVISYEVEEDKIFSLLNDTVETTEEFTLLTDMLSRLSTIELNENNREETFNNIKDEFEIIKNNHNELVTTETDNKVAELLGPVVSKANEKINEVDNKIVDIENAISEADSKINNAIAKIPPKSELIGEKGDKGEKGEKGDKGDRGEQGLQGIQGIQGIQGERGLQGVKGDKGDKGEQGIQGLKGDKGDKGDRGEQGVKGDTPSITHLETSINNKIQEVETRFNTLTSTQQQDAEVIDARDGETSLKARLDRDLAKGKIIEEQTEGNFITVNDSIGGYIHNVEVLGNTVQDLSNLADIKSVGELQEDGTYKMSILSCGKNLFDISSNLENLTSTTSYERSENTLTVKATNSAGNAYVSYNDIIFKDNIEYTLSFEAEGSVVSGEPWVQIVNADGTHFNRYDIKPITFIAKGKTSIRFYSNIGKGVTKTKIYKNIQIEEGTQATPYEPYQENKCDILLPCQLEKVGDVADRIICKDGVWGVEKLYQHNWDNISFTADINQFDNDDFTGKYNVFRLMKSQYSLIDRGIYPFFRLDGSFAENFKPYDGECVWGNGAYLYFKILKGKTTLDEFKAGKSFDFIVLSDNPQFIPLPRDTQIALNSFFGTTHIYMESGEVEGTIKCKIPKSLGATVQSLNNKTDILSDRIEAIEGLKDSQNMKYETDKGYLICKETKNGVIDDLKIEGKTIKNLLGNQAKESITLNNSMKSKLFTLLEPIKAGTEIFIRVNITAKKAPLNGLKVNTYNADGSYSYFTGTTGVYEQMFSIKPTQDISKLGFYMPQSEFDNDVSANITFKEAQVTLINVGTGYFEGLMSVGEDVDKIEVLSRKEDGNLFDGEFENGSIGSDGLNLNEADRIRTSYTRVKKGSTIFISFDCEDTRWFGYSYDKSKKPIGRLNSNNDGSITLPSNCEYVRFRTQSEATNHQISYKNVSYMTHQSDKKQILFYNENGELEPIQELHEWDSIEKHSDNKWYYHKRSGKVVLNGSESWVKDATKTTTQVFKTTLYGVKTSKIICDKFPYNLEGDVEKIVIAGDLALYIAIAINKLSENSITGFKQWLQTNNVTVVYQLAQEEVYELAPLHLDSYANETLILCNSGAISPKMEFSITSHINELVKAYGERINLLEEKVYKYMVTQNRMQLASTYSADSVTFKVDYFSLCGDEENYDEDLYNLILNNILVGKDNYDYDKMFTMILDYASWNQISWEQFDILVGLMDMQHNPPVEEFPTEDEIEEDIIENEETPVE